MEKTQAETASGFFGGVSASCPAGKKVLGGGAIATTSTGGVENGFVVLNDSPSADTGWIATFDISNPLGDAYVLKVTAICPRGAVAASIGLDTGCVQGCD